MTKLSLNDLPDVFVSHSGLTKLVFREMKRGILRKLASRLYTKNLIDEPKDLIRRHLWPIVDAFFPGGLVADRTAILIGHPMR